MLMLNIYTRGNVYTELGYLSLKPGATCIFKVPTEGPSWNFSFDVSRSTTGLNDTVMLFKFDKKCLHLNCHVKTLPW